MLGVGKALGVTWDAKDEMPFSAKALHASCTDQVAVKISRYWDPVQKYRNAGKGFRTARGRLVIFGPAMVFFYIVLVSRFPGRENVDLVPVRNSLNEILLGCFRRTGVSSLLSRYDGTSTLLTYRMYHRLALAPRISFRRG